MYKPFYKKINLPSYIGKPIFIEGSSRISIGRYVSIFPGIRIEAHRNGSVTICDHVYIGQNCHITSEDSDLFIGEGTSVMAEVCITNIDHKYEVIDTPILKQGYITRKTYIGKTCFIGHGAVIQAGVKLGDHVIVGANSVVCCGGEIPDYCVIAGSPARVIKKYNKDMKMWENV